MNCRHCNSKLNTVFIDLGSAPLSNAYLSSSQLHEAEKYYPLRVLVCDECWLVQTEDYVNASEVFNNDYAYFSSFSTTWLEHCKRYVDDIILRFGLSQKSNVVEIASNDGYLLQYVKVRNIPCLGIEPTASTASAAREKGIPTIEDFFGVRLAYDLVSQNQQADLMIANNVLAHVPDINDFLKGFTLLLKPEGIATFEFPHLLNLVTHNQFDTIYHEHFSYLSLHAVDQIFEHNGLAVFDVEEIPTHGGSLRVYSQKKESGHYPISTRFINLLEREARAGIKTVGYYTGFQSKAEKIKDELLNFLLQAKKEHKKIAAYGAAAKGNTLFNYAGIRRDLVSYVVDSNPSKQGKYLPGSHIPILSEESIHKDKPEYVLVLPWNLRDEIMKQLSYIREWNGQFVIAVPKLEIL
jgi:SAM-dependent methyltransferase